MFEDQYVRAANPQDKAAVLRLLASERLVAEFLAKEFVVCQTGGRVIGCARARSLPEGGTELVSLVVDPNHRGKGVGQDLVTMALLGSRHPVYALVRSPEVFFRTGFEAVTLDALPDSLLPRVAGADGTPAWIPMRLRRVPIPALPPEPTGSPDFLES